ncbi:MAG TPA: biotin/lipoyl-containing protein, partial [Phycisphaerae bacterium]|nr:biotin/lipoyl-containing protein [Phycisphaerae bacterium]
MSLDIAIPELGESITEAQIGQWRKAVGDRVERDEPLVELETDKATMDLPAPSAGTIEEILKQSGDVVGIGEVIARLSEKVTSDAKPPSRTKAARNEQPQSEKVRSQEAAKPGTSSRADRAGGASDEKQVQPDSARREDRGDGEGSRTEKAAGPSASSSAVSRPIDAALARLKGAGLPASEGDRGE